MPRNFSQDSPAAYAKRKFPTRHRHALSPDRDLAVSKGFYVGGCLAEVISKLHPVVEGEAHLEDPSDNDGEDESDS